MATDVTDLKSTLFSNISINEVGTGKMWSTCNAWEAACPVADLTKFLEEVTVTSLTGTFEHGEALTFSVSGATANVIGNNAAGTKMWYIVTGGTPAAGDVITGANSTQTATLSSVDNTNTGASAILEAYGNLGNSQILVNGVATSKLTYSRALRAAPGEAISRDGLTGARFTRTSRQEVFYIQDDNFHTEQMGAKMSYAADEGSDRNIFYFGEFGASNTAKDSAAVRCVVQGCRNTGAGGSEQRCFAMDRGHNVVSFAVNCNAYNNDGPGFWADRNAHFMMNCTARDCNRKGHATTYGIRAAAQSPTFINMLGHGNGTADFSGSSTNWSNCVSSDATAAGTAAVINANVTFLGGNDYGLASTSVDAREDGTSLDAHASYAFTKDFDGTERPLSTLWDVGFHEAAAPASALLTVSVGSSNAANWGDGLGGMGRGYHHTDQITLSDLLSGMGRGYNPSDQISLSDATALLYAYLKIVGDQISMSDVEELLLGMFHEESDDLDNWADAIASQFGIAAVAGDQISMSDAAKLMFNYLMSQSDQMTLDDALAALSTYLLAVSDQLSLSDATALLLQKLKAVADQFTLDDSTNQLLQGITQLLTVSIGDTMNEDIVPLPGEPMWVDNVSKELSYLLSSPTDQLILSDALSARFSHFLEVSDQIILSDAASAAFLGASFQISSSDQLILSDAFEGLFSHLLETSDQFTLDDAFEGLFSHLLETSDQMVMSDAALDILFHYNITGADDLNLWTDASAQLLDAFITPEPKTVADTLNFWAESLAVRFCYCLSSADQISMGDSVAMLFVHAMQQSDQITLSDSIEMLYSYNLETTDDMNSWSDTVDSRIGNLLSTEDSLSISDAVSMLFGYRLGASDQITISDTIDLSLVIRDDIELSAGDNLANWLDAAVATLLTSILANVNSADDMNVWADNLSMQITNYPLTRARSKVVLYSEGRSVKVR